MSDDEEIQYVKKTKTIHYASLEEQERTRQTAEIAREDSDEDDSDKEGQAMDVGNINTHDGEYFIYIY